MSLELPIAAALLVSLTFYVLFGGADFGAGVWTLFALGPHGSRQRAVIDRAIAPIWEANHVWLIVAVTILFTAFPSAFALISTRLHIPLTVMLIGIVLRGSAFAFRTNDVAPPGQDRPPAHPFWRFVFAVSSVLTPVMLGVSLGAVASGRLALGSGSFMATFVEPWLAPFPVAVGLTTLALFAYLAAVYLLVEIHEPDLLLLFRRRALVSWSILALAGAAAIVLAKTGAPEIYRGLLHTPLGLTGLSASVGAALFSLGALWSGRYGLARVGAAGQGATMIWGWALAQYPYLVEPDILISDAAPAATLRLLLWSLVLGSFLLFPSLYYLYRVFKS